MSALLDVIVPVFLIIGCGYCTVWTKLFSEKTIDGLMSFTQNFAIPVLLFDAIAKVDLVNVFDLNLFLSFYLGATVGFLLGFFGSYYLFSRPVEDSVVIGFCCLFSNTVMLGLPITERAFGEDALRHNFALVSIHAPFCYFIGITVMEFVKSSEKKLIKNIIVILKAMFSNALVVGIILGFLLIFRNPSSIFHSVIHRYDNCCRFTGCSIWFGRSNLSIQPQGDIGPIMMICAVSLIIHPAIVWFSALNFGLSETQLRSAVITAAMAPGINTYVFANIYGRGKRVASTGVLVSTGLSIGSIWLWLSLLS